MSLKTWFIALLVLAVAIGFDFVIIPYLFKWVVGLFGWTITFFQALGLTLVLYIIAGCFRRKG